MFSDSYSVRLIERLDFIQAVSFEVHGIGICRTYRRFFQLFVRFFYSFRIVTGDYARVFGQVTVKVDFRFFFFGVDFFFVLFFAGIVIVLVLRLARLARVLARLARSLAGLARILARLAGVLARLAGVLTRLARILARLAGVLARLARLTRSLVRRLRGILPGSGTCASIIGSRLHSAALHAVSM